nr:hypothetical protein [Lactobacillus helveticus]
MYFRKHMSNDEFIKKSNETLRKFLTIQASIEKDEGDKKMYMNVNIFNQSYIDTDYNAWIRVSPPATKYFNNLSQWTQFALETAYILFKEAIYVLKTVANSRSKEF